MSRRIHCARELNIQSTPSTATASPAAARNASRSLAACLAVLLLAAATAVAQQSAQPTPQPDAPLIDPVPAPPVTRATPFVSMTPRDRVQDYIQQNFFSAGAFLQTFTTGLGDYAGDTPPWDSGALGFAEHQGSEFARFTIAGTIHSSMAAVLHQDTRYFPCACKGFVPRTVHALGRTLFTYNDNGHRSPDVSGLAGIYGGPMLMTYWYPSNYPPLGYGVRQGNIAAGITAAIYVLREFTPELQHAIPRRHRHPAK